jgi:hypothetical protein
MLEALLLKLLKPQGIEIRDIIQSISFTDFVVKTAPKTAGTELPQLAQNLVNCISLFCKPDENDNFAMVRGGSIRSDLFNNNAVDYHFSKIFSNINKSLLGDDPLAGQVIDKVFSLPKDIDIFFRSKSPNEIAHQDNMLFHNVIQELEINGYKQIKQNVDGNVLIFDNGQYQVKVLKHQTGIHHSQTLVKIDFSKNGEDIMKLHFGLIPNKVESEEDPRFFKETADIEQEAVGYLSKSEGDKIILRHFEYENIRHANLYISEHYFDPIFHPFKIEPEKNPDQIISSRLREINFRVALFPLLFQVMGIKGIDVNLHNTPYEQVLIEYENAFKLKSFSDAELNIMQKWFQKYSQNLKDHFKLTASDLIYGLTVNPFLFFLFALPTNILDAFPLGKKLKHKSIIDFLSKLAQQVGGDITKDTLLVLSCKYEMYIKNAGDTTIFQLMKFLGEPETISAFLKLVDPLKLT